MTKLLRPLPSKSASRPTILSLLLRNLHVKKGTDHMEKPFLRLASYANMLLYGCKHWLWEKKIKVWTMNSCTCHMSWASFDLYCSTFQIWITIRFHPIQEKIGLWPYSSFPTVQHYMTLVLENNWLFISDLTGKKNLLDNMRCLLSMMHNWIRWSVPYTSFGNKMLVLYQTTFSLWIVSCKPNLEMFSLKEFPLQFPIKVSNTISVPTQANWW